MSLFSGKKVAVVGMGLSGVAAAKLLEKNGASVVITDDKTAHDMKEALSTLQGLAVDCRLGGINSEALSRSDTVVISPGVPSDLPPIEKARREGVRIISEIELAYSFCEAPVVAITGTNGKTTTTMLAHNMAVRAGCEAGLAGNIGVPFSDIVCGKAYGAIILEISSFQLENIETFKPRVAVLLNISSDHLDRYHEMEDYVAAKLELFKNQTGDDFAVLNQDDPAVAEVAREVPSRVLGFSMERELEQGVFLRGETVIARFEDRETEFINISEIPLLGRHNIENVLAATAALLPLNLSMEKCSSAVSGFPGVEHRLEKVRDVNGVLFVNDSKATNIVALEKSLQSFDRPVILIAGGRGKKSSYHVLRSLFETKVKAMITIGEDAPLLEQALGDLVHTRRADTLDEAVMLAASLAEAGDCVLLAPACASFDMFRNYGHRGKVFKEAVENL